MILLTRVNKIIAYVAKLPSPHHHSSPTLKVKWPVTYINVYKFSLPCPHFGSFYHNTLVNKLDFFLSLHCSHHDRFLFYIIFKYKIVCDKLNFGRSNLAYTICFMPTGKYKMEEATALLA